MKKVILGALALTVLGGAFLYIRLDNLVKAAIEGYGPKLTQTTVTVRRVSLSPLSGHGRLKGLVIGSPAGFTEPCVFRLGEVRVALDLKSLTKDTVVVHEIDLEAPEIHYEVGRGGTNFARLERNVESFMPPSSKNSAPLKKIRIDRFTARHGKVYANLLGLRAGLPLPDITLTNLGSGGGLSMKEAFGKILSALSTAALKVMGGGQMLKSQAGAVVQDALQGFKKLFKK